MITAGVPKPKRPEGSTSSKDTDSRASTPSKEVTRDEKQNTSSLNTSASSSRSRSNKPASGEVSGNKESSKVTAALGTAVVAVATTAEKDARDEGPKYVNYILYIRCLVSDLTHTHGFDT